MRDEYPCLGLPFTSQKAAALAMEFRKQAVRDSVGRLPHLELYICIEGHWHYREVR